MPDGKDSGYSVPCDGPGTGSICDICPWDGLY